MNIFKCIIDSNKIEESIETEISEMVMIEN
jgi:hypothetical protein